MQILGRIFQIIALIMLLGAFAAGYSTRGSSGSFSSTTTALLVAAGAALSALVCFAVGFALLALEQIVVYTRDTAVSTHRAAEALEALAARRRSS
jgi:TRAP-type C4-dicarboxylate transport system permease small subunit